MAERTDISWVNRTWSPWIGCQKVGPACDGCYAEHLMDTRLGRVVWGPGEDRKRTSPGYWKQLRKWEREAAAKGERDSVFPSLCDPWDNAVPLAWVRDYFDEIRATPHIDHLLLTKRPGNIVKRFHEAHRNHMPEPGIIWGWPKNAWIGATVVTQQEADRDVPKLLAAKRELEVPVAFLSMEPLLEAVDLTNLHPDITFSMNGLTGEGRHLLGDRARIGGIDWVITGGETDQGKHKARPTHPDWFRSLRDQCEAAGVAFHFKQWGANLPCSWDGEDEKGRVAYIIDEGQGGADYDDLGRAKVVQALGLEFAHFHHGKTGRLLDGVTHDARPMVQA